MFLEKAPKNAFSSAASTVPEVGGKDAKVSTKDLLQADATTPVDATTLFVRNLNFITSTESLRKTFSNLTGFVSALVKTKPDPKNRGQALSMGFGFIEFRSKQEAEAALATLNGYTLDGYKLDVRMSQKSLDRGAERRRADQEAAIAAQQKKIIVKNLPFQVTKKDIRELFGAYGQLRTVRVPQKMDHTARGFAFCEFTTPREAANAMNALKNTHLLGRKLVLEYAAVEAIDAEEEIAKMQQKVGKQVNKVAMKQLMGGGRQKFHLGGNEDEG